MLCKSGVRITTHVVEVRVAGSCHVHLQVHSVHHFGVPVTGGIEDVVDGNPRVDEHRLPDYWQLRTAGATS